MSASYCFRSNGVSSVPAPPNAAISTVDSTASADCLRKSLMLSSSIQLKEAGGGRGVLFVLECGVVGRGVLFVLECGASFLCVLQSTVIAMTLQEGRGQWECLLSQEDTNLSLCGCE
jgi:hypothetical protein